MAAVVSRVKAAVAAFTDRSCIERPVAGIADAGDDVAVVDSK